MGNKISKVEEEMAQVLHQVESWDIKKVNEVDMNRQLDQIRERVKAMGDICDVVKIKTSTAERFIDKYIPIKIQTQISETLQSVLGKSYLDKLEQYEFEKYQELNNNVLCEE